jgi:DNA-3-methyladenine glycosylase I
MGVMTEGGRCPWAVGELYEAYHDLEWGVPAHDERHLFEMLILEGAQAGLSWITVLKKRERYRELFEGFEPERVARIKSAQLEKFLKDPGIIRNRLKVESTVINARAWIEMREAVGSVDRYLWQFVGGVPQQNRRKSMGEVPARTEASDAMSKDLKRRGFKFVGSTICYAYMQAVGMVNDHLTSCARHKQLGG